MNRYGLSDPEPPFRSRWILAQPADSPFERARHFALRREVFVQEQGLFTDSDRDEHDAVAVPIVALSTWAGVPTDVIGTVRIYPVDAGVWFGGRLAVSREYRRCMEVGSSLTRAAVGSARGLGAKRFLATVQADNEAFFLRNHFRTLSALSLYDQPHRLMEAELSAFPVPLWCTGASRPKGMAEERAA